MQSGITDAQLLALYLQREEAAVEQTDRKYGNYLYSIAYQILSDDSDCRECQNDTYLSAWNHIPPDRPKSFAAYLGRIIHNLALDRYRQRTRQKRIPTMFMDSLEELSEVVGGTTPEAAYDDLRLRKLINGFVQKLSRRERYIFVCRYYCGDPVGQIAKTLGISQSAVFKSLARNRQVLKQLVEKEGYPV